MRDAGPAARSLTLSQARANAVRDYLVEAGIHEGRIRAEGFGVSRPVPGAPDSADPANERVEVTIVEP
jgi:outer membrane protein OmpA-like peptidoglycan-associated protein